MKNIVLKAINANPWTKKHGEKADSDLPPVHGTRQTSASTTPEKQPIRKRDSQLGPVDPSIPRGPENQQARNSPYLSYTGHSVSTRPTSSYTDERDYGSPYSTPASRAIITESRSFVDYPLEHPPPPPPPSLISNKLSFNSYRRENDRHRERERVERVELERALQREQERRLHRERERDLQREHEQTAYTATADRPSIPFPILHRSLSFEDTLNQTRWWNFLPPTSSGPREKGSGVYWNEIGEEESPAWTRWTAKEVDTAAAAAAAELLKPTPSANDFSANTFTGQDESPAWTRWAAGGGDAAAAAAAAAAARPSSYPFRYGYQDLDGYQLATHESDEEVESSDEDVESEEEDGSEEEGEEEEQARQAIAIEKVEQDAMLCDIRVDVEPETSFIVGLQEAERKRKAHKLEMQRLKEEEERIQQEAQRKLEEMGRKEEEMKRLEEETRGREELGRKEEKAEVWRAQGSWKELTDPPLAKEIRRSEEDILMRRVEANPEHSESGSEPSFSMTLSSATPDDLTGFIIRDGEYPVYGGGYADVYKGVLTKQQQEIKVAVKVIRAHTYSKHNQEKIDKRLRREIRLWACLRQHPHVVPLLGTTMDFGSYTAMVCPWMSEGNLNHYLNIRKPELTLRRRLQILADVVEGLCYVHARPVIHGDLTTANILMDGGRAHLSDFGLSNVMPDIKTKSFFTSTVGGAPRWRAPELLCSDNSVPDVTKHADIYSFGSIALQVISGRIPYEESSDYQVIIELMHARISARPSEPLLSDTLWDFILLCWSKNPSARPDIEQVKESLQLLHKSFSEEFLEANVVDADVLLESESDFLSQ